ncbi:MAG TPA: hypothetical protein VFV08_15915, partial [Puia sp.]|nr:hypothetical protein [Puia sp.]
VYRRPKTFFMRIYSGCRTWLLFVLAITLSLAVRANSANQKSNFLSSPFQTDTLPDHDYYDEIDKTVKDAIQSIDWDRIRDQVSDYFKNMNGELDCMDESFDQVQDEIDRAIKELDIDEIRKETQRAMQHGALDFDLTDMIESAIEGSFNMDEQEPEIEVEWSDDTSCANQDELNDSLESARMEMEENGETINQVLSRAMIK